MDWGNERYARLYTRDSTTWKLLSWQARATFVMLLRKVDRAGVLEVGEHGVLGLAAVVELPLDVVEAGIAQLTDPRLAVVAARPRLYVIPNYIEAQEAVQTDPQRAREHRARRRDIALAEQRGIVTNRDDETTGRDDTITHGHVASHAVTPSLADPKPNLEDALPRARSAAPPTPAASAQAQTPPQPQTDIRRAAAASRLAQAAWSEAYRLHAENQHLEPAARNSWTGAITPRRAGIQEALARIDELLEQHGDDEAAVRTAILNRIAVAFAEAAAKSPPTLRWTTPAAMFRKDSFDIGVDLVPEQVKSAPTSARAGPAVTTDRRNAHQRVVDNQLARVAKLEAEERAAESRGEPPP